MDTLSTRQKNTQYIRILRRRKNHGRKEPEKTQSKETACHERL